MTSPLIDFAAQWQSLRQVAVVVVDPDRYPNYDSSLPQGFKQETKLLVGSTLREDRNDWYHWHLELKPTLAQHAGFEWASGCTINPTPPEEAAAFLRQTEA